jgi:hypothetical protein
VLEAAFVLLESSSPSRRIFIGSHSLPPLWFAVSVLHRVPRTKATCLLHTWRPHRQRPFALVLHLHQYESSRNLHLQYLAKNQSTQRCQSLITQGSDHPPVLEPHMVLNLPLDECIDNTHMICNQREKEK